MPTSETAAVETTAVMSKHTYNLRSQNTLIYSTYYRYIVNSPNIITYFFLLHIPGNLGRGILTN